MGSCSDARSHFLISMWNYYKYHDIIDVFDESETLNLPKSENAKQPQCPEEKEMAITKGLRGIEIWQTQ